MRRTCGMFRLLRGLFLIIFSAIMTACQTLNIDESFVFQPGLFGDPDAVRNAPMRYESIFTEPTDIVIDVWADGQKAKHYIRSSEFVKSTVTHDVIKSPEAHLAITYVERPETPRPLVVHCGGNASDRYESGALYAQKIIPFADVLMFDYPGYGESTGRADAQSLRRANRIIAGHVRKNYAGRRPLILWGHSLGGFVCADMVQYFPHLDGLILEATATNAQDVSAAVVPWYAKLFVRPQVAESLAAYDMVELLKEAEAPRLILGAAKDKTLPVELSRKLAAELTATGREVTYTEFPEGNHISIPVQSTYNSALESFISSIRNSTYYDQSPLTLRGDRENTLIRREAKIQLNRDSPHHLPRGPMP